MHSDESSLRLGRYAVEERIGAGGMGVVYRALDLDRNEHVALKTLQHLTPSSLLRLKREFRAAADLAHPNLVALRELVSDGDDWFYTMELVRGRNFYAHVRGDHADSASTPSPAAWSSPASETTFAMRDDDSREEAPPRESGERRPRPISGAGLERLRAALPQLARAVRALHAARILHRDIKPGNVLVDEQGRVVVLDFGLVGELNPNATEGSFCGTPAYAAPEQVHSPATPASDWYAVGVMLYEALTGRLPFRGDPAIVLAMKQSMDPVSPAAIADAPADLSELAMALLSRDPAKRPSAEELMGRVRAPRTTPGATISVRRSTPEGPEKKGRLIGRERELAELYAALTEVRAGRSTLVRVFGTSGIGKTALVKSFCEEVTARGRALTLVGRCYERESVPFKALDPIVDALARRIASLDEKGRSQLLSDAFGDAVPTSDAAARGRTDVDRAALADLVLAFPVLMNLAPSPAAAEPRDKGVQQRQAARALGALLRVIARETPLVLWTDDLQWGDRDSARFVAELLSAPGADGQGSALPVLWIGSYRQGTERESPFLLELFALTQGRAIASHLVDIPILPLRREDARRLARARLGESMIEGGVSEERAEALVSEAAGSPYFIEELAQHVRGGVSQDDRKLTIEGLIDARLESLDPATRRLVEMVAVAGEPVPQRWMLEAASISEAKHASIATLRAAQLVRTYGAGPDDLIEPWHDRVRETVYAALAPSVRRERHTSLARVLAELPGVDSHRLATHFFHGGDLERAASHAIEAAEKAARALAFDRAASLYALAIECVSIERCMRLELERKCADAMVGAGRCADAAKLYLAAATHLMALTREVGRADDLRRRAAEQLLTAGRLDEGISVLGPLLDGVGVGWPETQRAATLSLVARIVRFEVLGTHFTARAPADVDTRRAARADLCWAAGSGLLSVDSVRGGLFMVRSLEEALRSGDRFRAARSLAIFGMMQVYGGSPRGVAKGRRIIDQAERVAAPLADPLLEGTIACCRGTADMSTGDWRRGLEGLEQGVDILRSRCVGVSWELGATISSTFNARLWLGENLEIARRAPVWRREAEAVGNWFSAVLAELYLAYALVGAGRIVEARHLADAALDRWGRGREFTYQEWLQTKTMVLCDLAERVPNTAEGRLERAWPRLVGSGLFGVELMLQDAHLLRGTTLLARLSARGVRSRRDAKAIAEVESSAKTLARISRPTALGAAELLRAGLAVLRRDTSAAASAYADASAWFRRVDVALLASVADARRAELIGGDEGASLLAAANAHAAREQIDDFAAWTRMHAPCELHAAKISGRD